MSNPNSLNRTRIECSKCGVFSGGWSQGICPSCGKYDLDDTITAFTGEQPPIVDYLAAIRSTLNLPATASGAEVVKAVEAASALRKRLEKKIHDQRVQLLRKDVFNAQDKQMAVYTASQLAREFSIGPFSGSWHRLARTLIAVRSKLASISSQSCICGGEAAIADFDKELPCCGHLKRFHDPHVDDTHACVQCAWLACKTKQLAAEAAIATLREALGHLCGCGAVTCSDTKARTLITAALASTAPEGKR